MCDRLEGEDAIRKMHNANDDIDIGISGFGTLATICRVRARLRHLGLGFSYNEDQIKESFRRRLFVEERDQVQ